MSLRARLVVAVCVVVARRSRLAGVATYTLFSQSQLRQIDDSLQRTHEPLEELVASERGGTGDDIGTESRRRRNDDGATGDRRRPRCRPRDRATRAGPARHGARRRRCGGGRVPAREPGHDPLTINVADLELPPTGAGGGRDQPSYLTLTAGRRCDRRCGCASPGCPTAACSSSVCRCTSRRSPARRLVTIEVIVAAVSLIVAAVLGWLLVRVGLRPLREVEQTALAIASGGDLDHEVPGGDTRDRGRPVGRRAEHDARPHPRRVRPSATRRSARWRSRRRGCAASWPTSRTSCARRWRP